MKKIGADPITTTVIQESIQAAATQMFEVLRKTAMSPIIYEVLDVGTGILDRNGALLSSGAGIPTFIGVLDKAVKRLIKLHPADEINEGDVFITNDPAFGGVTHLNDVVIVQPVFAHGKRIAWTGSIAHWVDVGGMTPGSISASASEIFQEGLRLPGIRLMCNQKIQTGVMEIITTNSRQPEFVQGDLWAQIAAGIKAATLLTELVEKHGINAFNTAIKDLFKLGKQRTLKGLQNLPTGVYEIDVSQDDGALWNAKITISKKQFIVDLRKNPDQLAAPHNLSRDGSIIAAQMIFKALTDPSIFANEGSFAPITVLTKPGSIFHADSAACSFYFETRIRLFNMLWRCLAQIIPERLPAGHFGSICGTVIAGKHPDTNRNFTLVEPQMGGWGATAEHDGLDANFSAIHGDTYNCPAEICEARYGIDVVKRSLVDDAKGKGRHRGGKGLHAVYAPRAPVTVAAGYSNSKSPVWGLAGGEAGSTNQFTIIDNEGKRHTHAFVSDLHVLPGQQIHITTARGGGWGQKNTMPLTSKL